MSLNLKRIIALYNDPDFTSYVAETIKNAKIEDIKGVEICEPQPPSEDFAFYAAELPSTFIYCQRQKMERSTLIIIQSLILVNHQCL